MRIRGERECQHCGTRWSYYETGSITCPECESPVSVGVGERTEHTDAPVEFDLTPVRRAVDEVPLREVAERAADRAGEYVRKTGFVNAGDLQPLPDAYLAAAELRQVGSQIAGGLRVDDPVELYFLELLRGADAGERPDVDDVPASIQAARGRAVASSVAAVQSDLRRIVTDPEHRVSQVLSTLTTHRKRVEALDGDVSPREAERLVRTVRDLLAYLREDDETALVRAQDRL